MASPREATLMSFRSVVSVSPKSLAFCAALLLVATQVSRSHAEGINLSWDDCGSAGQSCKGFLCNTNTGARFSLVASFVPPAGVDAFVGVEGLLDIHSSTPTMPDWWAFGSGQCRATGALSLNFDFTNGPFTCTDATSGQALGGFLYTGAVGGPDHAQLKVQLAVPSVNAGPLDPGTEYYAFKVLVSPAKSNGAGSCSGCNVPVYVTLNSIQLFQLTEENPILTTPIVRNTAEWQTCPAPVQVQVDAHDLTDPNFIVSGDGVCLPVNQVQNMVLPAGSHQTLRSCAAGTQVAFDVDAAGHLAYDPSLEGVLNGAGSTSLTVHGRPVSVNAEPIADATYD